MRCDHICLAHHSSYLRESGGCKGPLKHMEYMGRGLEDSSVDIRISCELSQATSFCHLLTKQNSQDLVTVSQH